MKPYRHTASWSQINPHHYTHAAHCLYPHQCTPHNAHSPWRGAQTRQLQSVHSSPPRALAHSKSTAEFFHQSVTLSQNIPLHHHSPRSPPDTTFKSSHSTTTSPIMKPYTQPHGHKSTLTITHTQPTACTHISALHTMHTHRGLVHRRASCNQCTHRLHARSLTRGIQRRSSISLSRSAITPHGTIVAHDLHPTPLSS